VGYGYGRGLGCPNGDTGNGTWVVRTRPRGLKNTRIREPEVISNRDITLVIAGRDIVATEKMSSVSEQRFSYGTGTRGLGVKKLINFRLNSTKPGKGRLETGAWRRTERYLRIMDEVVYLSCG